MSTTHSANQPIDRTQNLASEHSVQRNVNARAFIYRLIGKEARQLAPLMFALVGCGLFLHFLGLIRVQSERVYFHYCILVLIPTLLAVGAGPMLVSQEKEQRTLGWIGSLPVPWRMIVLSKLLISLLALVFVWLISIGLTYLFLPSVFLSGQLQELTWLFWGGNTFFLLFFGFALTWLFPTAVSTLVASLLTISGAVVVSSCEQQIVNNFGFESEIESWLIANYLLILGIVGCLAIRFGGRSFVATASSPSTLPSWWSKLESRYRKSDRPQKETQSPASSLIWQIGTQNRMLWISFGQIVLMGIGWLFYVLGYSKTPDFLVFIGVLGCLILSWLGVSVFGSDANRQRIRFLAERGIAPGLVWWTRLILPTSLVAIGLLVFIAAIEALLSTNDSYENSNHFPGIPWALTIVGVLSVFAFTQWFSQWTRSTLIVFCLAPAVALFAVGYQVFAKEFLDASWWLIVASIAMAFVATRVMLFPWMDSRFGLRYYLSHGAMLFVSLIIPAIPFLITFTTYPAMPSALRQALEVDAKAYGKNSETIELVLTEPDEYPSAGATSEESNNFSHSIDQILTSLEAQLTETSEGLLPTYRTFQFVVDTANLAVLRLDSDATNEAAQIRYRRCFLLLSTMAERMRLNEKLVAQEYADRIEAWLVRELEQPNRQQILGSANVRQIAKSLSDKQFRYKARRRAIVVSWNEATHDQYASSFGGMILPSAGPTSTATTWLVAERDLGLATAELLKYLDKNGADSGHFPDELAKYWKSVHVVNNAQESEQLSLDSILIPGMMWHQDWEDRAQRLIKSLQ